MDSSPLPLQTEMRDQHVQHKNEVSRLRNQLQDVRHRLVAMQTRLRQTPPSSPSGGRRALSGSGIAGGSAPPSPGASLAQSPAHFSRSGSAPRTPTRSAAVAGAFASPAELTAALLRQHLADEAGQSSSAPRTPRAAPRVDPISVQFARARKAAEELDTADVYAVLEEEEALRFTYAALSELDSEASDDDGSSGAAAAAAAAAAMALPSATASPALAAHADSNLDLQQQLERLRTELERSRQQQIARTKRRQQELSDGRLARLEKRIHKINTASPLRVASAAAAAAAHSAAAEERSIGGARASGGAPSRTPPRALFRDSAAGDAAPGSASGGARNSRNRSSSAPPLPADDVDFGAPLLSTSDNEVANKHHEGDEAEDDLSSISSDSDDGFLSSSSSSTVLDSPPPTPPRSPRDQRASPTPPGLTRATAAAAAAAARRGETRAHSLSPRQPMAKTVASGRAAAAQRLKQEGNAMYSAGDYAGAARCYTVAIAATPGDPVFWSNRAAAWIQLSRYEAALQDSLQSTKLDPTFVKGHLRAGRSSLALGRVECAKMHFEEALRHAAAAQASSKENSGDDVNVVVQKAAQQGLAQCGRLDGLLSDGRAHLVTSAWEAALEAAHKALALAPMSAESNWLKADALICGKCFEEAAQFCKKRVNAAWAAPSDSTSQGTATGASEASASAGAGGRFGTTSSATTDGAAASAAADGDAKGGQHDRDPELGTLFAKSLHLQGQFDEASAVLQEVLSAFPKHLHAQREMERLRRMRAQRRSANELYHGVRARVLSRALSTALRAASWPRRKLTSSPPLPLPCNRATIRERTPSTPPRYAWTATTTSTAP